MTAAFKALVTIAAILISVQSFAHKTNQIPDIPPDATTAQYQAALRKYGFARANVDIQYAIKLGERNLAWLTHMNTFRPDGKKIQLTKVGDLKGIPIENAKSYSPTTIKESYDTTYRDMPSDMAKVLYSSAAFTNDVPIAEADYIIWANKVDKNYQTAVRWTLMEPYLNILEKRRADDLRGFYFLSKKTPNVEVVLKGYATQTAESQKNISAWMLQMCQNTYGINAGCEAAVAKAIQAGTLLDMYTKTLPKSQALWDEYFALENPRKEIIWSSKNPDVMNVPFRDPKNDTIKDFLKVNIEDEFKWNTWGLKINIMPLAQIHVDFQAGVTPHVNGAGGDTIVMDANTPLTEWDVQWTIRHEFGHVLGFVDCYLEFYDPSEKAIVTYQLDIDHLMCARSGRMQQGIFDTLKRYYYK